MNGIYFRNGKRKIRCETHATIHNENYIETKSGNISYIPTLKFILQNYLYVI